VNVPLAPPLWRILLVEDNSGDVALLRLALQEAGLNFELTVINDGAQALNFVKLQAEYTGRPKPDLAVLDLHLPRHSGVEVLEAIRSSEHLRQVPVVTLSALPEPHDQAKVRALGIDCQIIKPIDLDDFMSIGTSLKFILETTSCRVTKASGG